MSMKQVLFAAGLALSLGGLSAKAQIVWSSPTPITGPTDVLQIGTFVGSATADNSRIDYTVGNVTFHYGGDAYVTLPNIGGTDGSDSPTPSSTSTDAANYNSSLEGCAYVGNDNSTANIILGSASHPLTVGQGYQVEIWDSSGFAGRTTTFTDTTLSATPTLTDSVTLNTSFNNGFYDQGLPQYAIGSFIATGATETITWESTPGSLDRAYGEVNDVLLLAIPEPSTYAMMLGGLVLLGVCVRRNLA